MYTKASCGYCKKAKNLLNEQKIDYAEHDLDKLSRSQPNGHQVILRSSGIFVLAVRE
jgi:glutaredoxin